MRINERCGDWGKEGEGGNERRKESWWMARKSTCNENCLISFHACYGKLLNLKRIIVLHRGRRRLRYIRLERQTNGSETARFINHDFVPCDTFCILQLSLRFGTFHKWRPQWEGGTQKEHEVRDFIWIIYCRSVPNADKGEGVQKSKNLVDVIYGWSLFTPLSSSSSSSIFYELLSIQNSS